MNVLLMRMSGLVSHRRRRTFVGNASGVSRGDRKRNARLARLRALVPIENAIVGIDLADKRQMVVVCDHDSRVLARRTFQCRAWDLGVALDWAAQRATANGFVGVTVSCEPTGHRWRVLGQVAADRGMSFVCVQTLQTSWARRSEDLTFDKTDDKDAVLIARLTAQLRCYIPEPVDETWGRLRHLGARREQLITDMGSQIQQIRALLECVWPAALDTARQPFRSKTWAAAMTVICDRDGGDLDRTRRFGLARFDRAVRREITRRGKKPSLRILRALFTALDDPAGVIAHRRGALERVQLLLEDWRDNQRKLAHTEQRMTAVLDELELTGLVTSIPGLSVVGSAAILAETGDPKRFATARALVKHAGLAPRENTSGKFTGRTKLTGQGRPGLRRLATWRARWGAQEANPVYGRQIPAPDHPRAQQAQPDAGANRDRRCDPATPARRHQHWHCVGPRHCHPRHPPSDPSHTRRLTRRSRPSSGRPGRALRGIETNRDLDAHHGQPARRLINPITRCWAQPHKRYAGTDDGRGTDQTLDANRLTLMSAVLGTARPMTPNPGCLPFVRVSTVPLRVGIVATARLAPELRCARARSTVAAVDMIHDLAAPVLPNPGRGMNVAGGINVTSRGLLSPVRSQLGPKVDPVLYTSCARKRRPSHSPYAHSVEIPVIPARIGENCHGATRTSGEADRAAQAAGDLPPGSARAEADGGVAAVGPPAAGFHGPVCRLPVRVPGLRCAGRL
jgi:transposase